MVFCTCRPLKLLPNPAAAARNTTAAAALRAGSRAGVGGDALQTQVVRLTPLTTARYQAGISVRKPLQIVLQKSTWLLLWGGLGVWGLGLSGPPLPPPPL